MQTLISYCLILWFWFFLLNYAGITAKPAAWLKRVLGPKLGYPLGCAFCWSWWVTLFAWSASIAPGWFVFAAPVVHLFVDLAYSRLSLFDPVKTVVISGGGIYGNGTDTTTLP